MSGSDSVAGFALYPVDGAHKPDFSLTGYAPRKCALLSIESVFTINSNAFPWIELQGGLGNISEAVENAGRKFTTNEVETSFTG